MIYCSYSSERILVISSNKTICSLGSKLIINSNAVITLDLGCALESADDENLASPSRANTHVFNKQDILNKSSSLFPIKNSPFIIGVLLHEYPAGLNNPSLI